MQVGCKLLRVDGSSLREDGRVCYPVGEWIDVPGNGAYVAVTGGLTGGGTGPLLAYLECDEASEVRPAERPPGGVRCFRRVRRQAMTIIAIIADSHFAEHSRFEECCRLHDWIATDIEKRQPALVLHAGDFYDRASLPAERAAAAGWLERVAEVAPVVVVRGNHDALGDLPLLARLRTRHSVIVEERAAVHVVAGVAVACLAWPRRGELLARVPSETTAGAAEACRAILSGLGGDLLAHVGPKVLLAHAMVTGSRTSAGQPLVGVDVELGLDDLALAGADLVALGHIHCHQHWDLVGQRVVYPGSPRRTAYGEHEPKGYVLAEVDHHGATWEFIETPATPMVDVATTWTPGHESATDGPAMGPGWAPWPIDPPPGAEVRFRYHVAVADREAAQRATADLRVRWEAAGCTVRVEPLVDSEVHARAPEVAAAGTLPEKLEAYWFATGNTPGEDLRRRLLGRLAELEADAPL